MTDFLTLSVHVETDEERQHASDLVAAAAQGIVMTHGCNVFLSAGRIPDDQEAER